MSLHRTLNAGLSCLLKTKNNIGFKQAPVINSTCDQHFRFTSTSSILSSSDKGPSKEDDKKNNGTTEQPATNKSDGWLGKVFSSASSQNRATQTSHSRVLSATEYIYEMHYHDARPDTSDDYVKKYETYSREVSEKTNKKAELVGSFRVEIGNQDQFIHIWRYHDGYKEASKLLKLIKTDETLVKLNRDQLKDLTKRESQFMMAFSFWGHPEAQDNKSFYEMRSYVLKPGTMIEWANGWSRGIRHRDNAVAGFFSQIGQLYTVHHIWRYEDLQMRKDVRENAWRRPGWDECVAITVPNIVYLHSRWMSPNSFSPIKDIVKIAPSQLGQPIELVLVEELNRRFANKVVLNVGLIICLKDILEIGESHIYCGDGAIHTRCVYRMIVFKPQVGEIICGTLKSSSKEGLNISLGFFDSIVIPPEQLNENTSFNEIDQSWTWKFDDEDDGQTHVYNLEVGEKLRFRVHEEQFVDVSPHGPTNVPSSLNNSITLVASDPSCADVPYTIIGSICESGLGLVKWWS